MLLQAYSCLVIESVYSCAAVNSIILLKLIAYITVQLLYITVWVRMVDPIEVQFLPSPSFLL